MGPHCSGAVRPGRAALLGHSRQHCSKKSSALLNPEHCWACTPALLGLHTSTARLDTAHCDGRGAQCEGGRSEVRVSEVAVHCRGRQPALMTAVLARARVCVHASRRASAGGLVLCREAFGAVRWDAAPRIDRRPLWPLKVREQRARHAAAQCAVRCALPSRLPTAHRVGHPIHHRPYWTAAAWAAARPSTT